MHCIYRRNPKRPRSLTAAIYAEPIRNLSHPWRALCACVCVVQANADFCFEPAGDTPFRKSLADSIAVGCIPVLFHPMTDNAHEWLWQGWKEATRVLIPRDAYLRGELSLYRLLVVTLPPTLLARMKRVLSLNAHKFTISYDDDPGDELHALLVGASRLASQLESQWKARATRKALKAQGLRGPTVDRASVPPSVRRPKR